MEAKKSPAGGPGNSLNSKQNYTDLHSKRQGLETCADPAGEFLQRMIEAGLEPAGGIVGDGQLRRFHVPGDKAGTTNGWYRLHPDHPPSGIFGSWKSGVVSTWCSKSRDRLTTAERETLQRRIEADRLARQEETAKQHAAAQMTAKLIWDLAVPAIDLHAYLRRKNVKSHGLRVSPWSRRYPDDSGAWRQIVVENSLLVPLTDWAGEIWSLQAIFPAKMEALGRDKDFLPGGRKAGLFYRIGEIDAGKTLILAEGYATGATLHEATGKPVLVCFDAGNLKPVAVEARRRYPESDLVVACDNDRFTSGNPGVTKGRAAAVASSARLLTPSFADHEPGSDWNDWYTARQGVPHG